MKLSELLARISYTAISGSVDKEILALTADSRKITPGTLFVCIKGFNSDGHRYIPDALRGGAVALLVEDLPDMPVDATVIQVPDTREALALLASAWFADPARKLEIIGITGTKGKTTTAHMIRKILEMDGRKVGMIGTLGAYIGDTHIPTRNTTPGPYELHEMFHQMVQAGCTHVVMEVSSQAMKHKRIAGIEFAVGIFLNISPDHIGAGEHADFEEYAQCKQAMFHQTRYTIANMDDPLWRQITAPAGQVFTISCKQEADLYAEKIHNPWERGFLGVEFQVAGKVTGSFRLNMPGRFNVENALAAIAVADRYAVARQSIAEALETVCVKGRMQLLPQAAHCSTFVIDYAHNAISMENSLTTLKDYHPKRLICLFGGGGNKPKQRRYDMGLIAGKYADLTILTMDNPRYETVEQINQDIIRGLEVYHGKYEQITDRKEAIEYLIDTCGPEDIVALIGKGHEEYQEVQGVKYYFSEEKIVEEYIAQKQTLPV